MRILCTVARWGEPLWSHKISREVSRFTESQLERLESKAEKIVPIAATKNSDHGSNMPRAKSKMFVNFTFFLS